MTGVDADLAHTLEQELATRPGMELHEAPLADDVRRMWKLGVVTDVRVELEPGGVLQFAVTTPRAIARVRVVGGDRNMARRFHLLEGAAFEPLRIQRMMEAARLAYARDGRVDAAIEAHTSTSRRGVDVCIEAKPGPKVTLAALQFTGRSAVSEATLFAAMKSKAPINRPNGLYDADAWDVDALYVLSAYWDRGFATAKIGEPRVERRGARIYVEVPVTEGPQFRYSRISTKPPVAIDLPIAAGHVYSQSKLIEAGGLIEKATGASVHPRTTLDIAKATVEVTFELEYSK